MLKQRRWETISSASSSEDIVHEVVPRLKRLLYCAYEIELLVADILERYADTLSDTFAKNVLRIISRESHGHARRLELIGTWLNLFEKVSCEDEIGEPWRRLSRLNEKVSSGSPPGLKEFIDEMSWFERAVGEETYNKLLLSLLGKIAGIYEVADKEAVEFISDVLEGISNDERRHEKWMLRLRDRAAPQNRAEKRLRENRLQGTV